MTKINILSGLNIPSQISLDPKTRCINELTLKDLGLNDNLAYTYYKGLEVTCIEERTKWEWKEVEIGDEKLLDNDFTYPNGLIVDDIDYSNKVYNFAKIVNEVELQNLQSVIDTGGVAEVLNKIVTYINQGDTNNKYTQFATFTDDGLSNYIQINKQGPSLYGSTLDPILFQNPQGIVQVQNGILNLKQFKGALNTILNFTTPIANTTLNLPAKSTGTYTLATLDDIPSVSNFMNLTTNQSFTGRKSSTNTGTTGINGLSFTNNGTGSSSSIDITNGSSGTGLKLQNNGSGSGAYIINNSSSRGLTIDNYGGIGIGISHYGTTSSYAYYANLLSSGSIGMVVNRANSNSGKAYIASNIGTISYSVDPKGYIYLNQFLVSTLPTPAEETAYATVTDALSPSYLTTVVGGGSVKCPVFWNGINWVCH